MKRRIAVLMLVLFLCLGALPVSAAPGKIEAPEGETLTLTAELNDPVTDMPISGVPCYIWLVAAVSGEGQSVHFDAAGTDFEGIFDEAFASRILDDTEAWDELAQYVDRNAIPATNAVYSNVYGRAVFTEYAGGKELVPGLYLVRCLTTRIQTGQNYRETVGGYWTDTYYRTYSFQRCMVMIPGGYFDMGDYYYAGDGWWIYDTTMKDDWDWTYQVVTRPKITFIDTVDSKFTPTPPPPPPPETKPETDPPETLPPETLPPETLPQETEPPETEPPETEPPETEPEPEETIPLIYPPEEIPEEPEQPWIPPVETPDETIPQTGLLWWPVPVMGMGGIACICVGSLIGRKKDNDDDGDDEA